MSQRKQKKEEEEEEEMVDAFYLSDGAPHAVNVVLKVDEVEQRLLLQLVQLLGEGVFLVLQDRT